MTTKPSQFLKSSCSGCIRFGVPPSMPSPFNSFSKFYCKFTCSLDECRRRSEVLCSFSSSSIVMFQLFMIHWHASSFAISFVAFLFSCCTFLSLQINYLRNYGYLPTTVGERFGDDILHEDVAMNALKSLQVRLTHHVFMLLTWWWNICFLLAFSDLEISKKQEFLMMQQKHCCESLDVEIPTLKLSKIRIEESATL